MLFESHFSKKFSRKSCEKIIEQCVSDTNAGKQLSEAATDVLLTLVIKNEQHVIIDDSFYHQMSLGKSECWYSNNCLHF
jgi:hypothetical protein